MNQKVNKKEKPERSTESMSQEIEMLKKQLEAKQEAPSGLRAYKDDLYVDHDLFKLETSKLKKNINWNPKAPPNWDHIDHSHHFHSYDSRGRKQTTSNSVGGHFHEVTVTVVDGDFKAECSPAIRDKRNGAPQYITEDHHTHDITYMYSERIKTRETNKEAVKVADHMNYEPSTRGVDLNPGAVVRQ